MDKKEYSVDFGNCGTSYKLFSTLREYFLRYSCVYYLTLTCILMSASINIQGAEKKYFEGRVKAAYIYNFLRFIKWPNEKRFINVCVYGYRADYDSAFSSMATLIEASKLLEIKIVKIIDSLQALDNCQTIFITSAAASHTHKILAYAKDSHSLTIGESEQFLEQGGMINFIHVGDKVRFEINVDAYKQAQLEISSKVLRIAERLIRTKDDE